MAPCEKYATHDYQPDREGAAAGALQGWKDGEQPPIHKGKIRAEGIKENSVHATLRPHTREIERSPPTHRLDLT
eukprot:6905569-Prorocentrum_lima.AAC.1